MRDEPGNRSSTPAVDRELTSGLRDDRDIEVWLDNQIGVPPQVLSATFWSGHSDLVRTAMD
jgi:hypothetical protein